MLRIGLARLTGRAAYRVRRDLVDGAVEIAPPADAPVFRVVARQKILGELTMRLMRGLASIGHGMKLPQ